MKLMKFWLVAAVAGLTCNGSNAARLDPDQCPRSATIRLANLKIDPLGASFRNDSRYGSQNIAAWSKVANVTSIVASIELTGRTYGDGTGECHYKVTPNEMDARGASIINSGGSIWLVGVSSMRIRSLAPTHLDLESEDSKGFPIDLDLATLDPYGNRAGVFHTIGYAQSVQASVP